MKLKKEFITYQTEDKHIMVSTDTKLFSGLVQSNASGAYIIESLKKETTRDQIIADMLKEFDASEDVIAHDVDKIIGKLRSIHALEE